MTNRRFSSEAERKLYLRWVEMKQRCYNPNNKRYKDYGGRSIFVCDSWRNNFTTFLKDVGLPPSKFHQLDRKDNNKGYDKENCKWSLAFENNNNKRFNGSSPKPNAGVCWDSKKGLWQVSFAGKFLCYEVDYFEAWCKRKSYHARLQQIGLAK